jgi:hypothetical protein
MLQSKMSLKRPTILLVLLSIVVMGGIATYWKSRPNLPSYSNSALAGEVQPGTTRKQLVKTLGDPVGENEGWVLFTPSPTATEPIRAKFAPSGEIEAIDIGQGNVRNFTKQ